MVTTNPDTGGTYTQEFAASGRDHTIVDNGDGTITITSTARARPLLRPVRELRAEGPRRIWTTFDLDYNGTPSDPSDDVDVPDSFQIVRPSTGNSDFGDRNFCEDLVEFTTP